MIEHASWSDFFVAQVGAMAALAGLLFVSISINLQRILEYKQLPRRAVEMLVVLVGALIACSIVLIPGQSEKLLGIELAVVGIVMWAVPMDAQIRALRTAPKPPLAQWTLRMLMTQLYGLPMLIGAAYLSLNIDAGFYWIAASVVATLIATVLNAWVLLVEIMR